MVYERLKFIYLFIFVDIILRWWGTLNPNSYESLYIVTVFLRIFSYALCCDGTEAKTNCFLSPRHFPEVRLREGVVLKTNRGCRALGIGLHWWIGKGVAQRWMSIAKTRKSDGPEEAHYSFFSQLFHFTPYNIHLHRSFDG